MYTANFEPHTDTIHKEATSAPPALRAFCEAAAATSAEALRIQLCFLQPLARFCVNWGGGEEEGEANS